MKREKLDVARGSGNVFRDFGRTNADVASALARNDPGLLTESDPPFAQKARPSPRFPDFVGDPVGGGQIVAATRIALKIIILPGGKNAARMILLVLAPMSNTRL